VLDDRSFTDGLRSFPNNSESLLVTRSKPSEIGIIAKACLGKEVKRTKGNCAVGKFEVTGIDENAGGRAFRGLR